MYVHTSNRSLIYIKSPLLLSRDVYCVLLRIFMTGQLSGVCRCPASILTSVRSCAEIDFLGLTSGSKTDESVAKDRGFTRTGNRTRDSESKAQYANH